MRRLLILVVLFSSLSIAEGADWRYFLSTKIDEKYYYDNDNFYKSGSIVRVPIKIVAEGKKAVQKRYDEAKSAGITLKGYENYKYRQFEAWEFNCSEKTIKWFGYADYDKNNKIIKSFKDTSTILHFETGSLLAVIHKLFCESQ